MGFCDVWPHQCGKMSVVKVTLLSIKLCVSLGCQTHTHTLSDVAVKLMGHDSDGSLFSQSIDSDSMLLKNSLSYVYKKHHYMTHTV